MNGQGHQQGAVIMIMLLILVLGSASFLLTKLGKGDARLPANLEATAQLGAITDALIGYALANGYCLPCPDTSVPRDGVAETSCGAGPPVAGALPWVSLGLGALDPWGRQLRYLVDPDFTGICAISLALQSDIAVQGVGAPNPPAVVISHGNNGFGGMNEAGPMPNPPPSHTDEEINRTATTGLVQRVASDDPSVAGGPFDDLLDWVDMGTYKARLAQVNGGPLPP